MIDLPTTEGGWAAIDADPPWYFRSYAPVPDWDMKDSRAIENHYPTMKLDDIKAMPVKEVAAADAHLFLWATGPCLPQALEVMASWGFRYSGFAFVWFKLRRGIATHQLCVVDQIESEMHLGLGFTTRKNVEICLLGRRGNARRNAKNVREVIAASPRVRDWIDVQEDEIGGAWPPIVGLDGEPLVSPVREHSRKPDEAFKRIERYCDGPYLQLFGRESRPGWTVWGNEASKFDEPAA